jgi:hypothetical protein
LKPRLKKITGIWFCVTYDKSASAELAEVAYERWARAKPLEYVWK